MPYHQPEDRYLRLLGLATFYVARFESGITGDLFSIPDLPPKFTNERLAGMTTWNLGEFILAGSKKVTNPDHKAWMAACGIALLDVAEERKKFIHSCGVTVDGKQQLERPDPSGAIAIDETWLEGFITFVESKVAENKALKHPSQP